jgi:hypothetical protein
MENKIVTSTNEKDVVEILRIIAEMTVYGDSKSEILFDFFCEKNMMAIFLDIMMTEQGHSCPVSVLVQILQTLSILISCVRNDTSLYYLLSNNRINQVIVFPYNLNVDESLRDHYVSFLKTLSMRLNKQTVNFLYIESASSFPLLTQAIKLLSIDENMSKIAAQTIILNIYQVEHEGARKYALQEVMIRSLCKKIVGIMINQYKHVVCKLYENMVTNVSALAERSYVSFYNHISDIFAAVEDWLYYIVDLLGLNIPDISSSLVLTIVNEFVHPFLIHPFALKSLDQQFATASTSPSRDNMLNKNLFTTPGCIGNEKLASPKKTIAPIIEGYVDSQTKIQASSTTLSSGNETSSGKLKKSSSKSKKSSTSLEDSKHLADSDDDEEDEDDDDDEEDEGFDSNIVGTGRSSVRSFEDTDFYPEFYSDGLLNPAKEHLKFAVAIAFLTRVSNKNRLLSLFYYFLCRNYYYYLIYIFVFYSWCASFLTLDCTCRF